MAIRYGASRSDRTRLTDRLADANPEIEEDDDEIEEVPA
jgi:hypothetical protein